MPVAKSAEYTATDPINIAKRPRGTVQAPSPSSSSRPITDRQPGPPGRVSR